MSSFCNVINESDISHISFYLDMRRQNVGNLILMREGFFITMIQIPKTLTLIMFYETSFTAI